jgi:hypothetical protein
MLFNKHSHLDGKHAQFSASKYHWITYDDEKLLKWVRSQMAALQGSRIHDLAAKLITLGVKLPRNNKTLSRYVNDAIGFRMTPEQVLYYSYNCFGTADAISFREEPDLGTVLRVHDLKTGVLKADMRQLMIYVALFCLEYEMRPSEIDRIELRIYQNDEVAAFIPDNADIVYIMDRIKTADRLMNEMLELVAN